MTTLILVVITINYIVNYKACIGYSFSAAADLTITKDRSEVVDFLQPFMEYHVEVFIQNPSGSYNYKAYTEPLHYSTWAALFITALFAPLVLFLVTK